MTSQMIRTAALVALLVFGVQVKEAEASTFTPDGLDGPCCDQTFTVLPALPDVSVVSRYICWQGCQGGLNGAVKVTFEPNPTPACGILIADVTVTNLPCSFTAWTGSLVMTYSRTWAEASVVGDPPDLQVYRFILNGDMTPSAALVTGFGGNECVVAPCQATYGSFHVQGYIDFAMDCDTGDFSVAYAFDHDCDSFEHDNTLTCRPGTFHPFVSYTWVGPSAGFVIDTTTPAASGSATVGAMRNSDFTMPLPLICQNEQPLTSALIGSDLAYCPCSSAAFQYKPQRLLTSSSCGSTSETVPVDVWPGLVGKAIGFWTDPTVYPGRETVHIERGFADYFDSCEADDFRPYFIGVQTQGGFETYDILFTGDTVEVSDQLLDLTNATWPGTASDPRIGKLSIADRMISLFID